MLIRYFSCLIVFFSFSCLDAVGQTGTAVPKRPTDSLLSRPYLQAVVEMQTARNTDSLLSMLSVQNDAVRARIALALASVQDTAAVPALLNLLQDPNPEIQAQAVFALGQTLRDRSSSMRPAFTDALHVLWYQTEDSVVHQQVLEAMGKAGDEAALDTLLTWAIPASHIADWALTMARFGMRGIHHPDAVLQLARQLRDYNPTVRRHAAYFFGRVPPADTWVLVTDSVRKALGDYDMDDPAAMHLLTGLGRLGDPADTPLLLHWLQHATDWRTRTNAARALTGQAGSEPVATAMVDALDDPVHHVVLSAANALATADSIHTGIIPDLETWIDEHSDMLPVIDLLLGVLAGYDEDDFVLEWLEERFPRGPRFTPIGLSALVDISAPEAEAYLFEAVESPDAAVAAAAVQALYERWLEERYNPRTHLHYFEAFSGVLRKKEATTIYRAAPALADSVFRPMGGLDRLQETLRQLQAPADVESIVAILDALGDSKALSVEAAIQPFTQHEHPLVSRTALDALERLTGTRLGVPEPALNIPTLDWDYLASCGRNPQLILALEAGQIVLELDAEQAPLTVQTILRLAEDGRFNGVPFHRVVPNFVIQGGDYVRGDGFGGTDFVIRSEFTHQRYERGVLGMASSGKDTESSQFFITHSMQPHLDGRYTAFGRVLEGMDVVDQVAQNDRITRAIVVKSPER